MSILSSTSGAGYILFGDGAAAASYVGQIRYSHTDNFMSFNTNGSERLRINSDGKVGIGTDNPDEKLDVAGNAVLKNGTTSTSLTLYETYTDTSNFEKTLLDHSGGYFEIDTGALGSGSLSGIKLSVGSYTKLQIEPDGHVLINGADDNGNKADFAVGVGGSPRVSWHGTQVQIGGTDMNYNGNITHDGVFRMQTWNSNISFECKGGSGAGIRDIIFRPFNDTSDTEAMRIKGSGNVGIGVNNPQDFNSSANNLVVGTGSGTQGMTIYGGSSGGSYIYFADGTSGSALYEGFLQYRHTERAMRFGVASGVRMTLDANGFLGIGTTTPDDEIDVEGADLDVYFKTNKIHD